MALNIKDAETDRLARELAEATGESITVATQVALRERLERVRAAVLPADAREQVLAIVERGRSRPLLDARPPEEILGYDDHGLPV